MFCPQCGNEVQEGVSFCSNCGASLSQEIEEARTSSSANSSKSTINDVEEDNHSSSVSNSSDPPAQIIITGAAEPQEEKGSSFERIWSHLKYVVGAVLIIAALNYVFTDRSGFDDSDFVGTWTGSQAAEGSGGLADNNFTLIISANGNWELNVSQTGNVLGTNYGSNSVSGTWERSANKINLNQTSEASRFTFLMSDDKSSLRETNSSLVLRRT